MERIYEKYFDLAIREFGISERLIHKTFYLLGDNKIIVQVLKVLERAIDNLIKGVLAFEASQGLVSLSKNPRKNYFLFRDKIGGKYFMRKELNSMDAILRLVARHRASPIEYIKKEKFILLVDGKYEILTRTYLLGLLDSVRPAFFKIQNLGFERKI